MASEVSFKLWAFHSLKDMKSLKKVPDLLRKPVSEDEAQHGNFFSAGYTALSIARTCGGRKGLAFDANLAAPRLSARMEKCQWANIFPSVE